MAWLGILPCLERKVCILHPYKGFGEMSLFKTFPCLFPQLNIPAPQGSQDLGMPEELGKPSGQRHQ